MRRLSSLRRVSLWLPSLVYMAVIYSLSAQSNPMPEVTARVWDKLLHTTEYGTLALLFARALFGEGLSWLGAILVAVLLTSGYGATDEYHQFFVPGRSSDVHDWFADTLGGAVGAGVYAAATILAARGQGRMQDPERSQTIVRGSHGSRGSGSWG